MKERVCEHEQNLGVLPDFKGQAGFTPACGRVQSLVLGEGTESRVEASFSEK